MALILERIQTDGIAALSYLVGDDAEGVAAVFDPRPDVDCYLQIWRACKAGARRCRKCPIRVDARKIPENFLDGFRDRDCASLDCRACGYCKRIATPAVSIAPEYRAEVLGKYAEMDNAMATGSLWGVRLYLIATLNRLLHCDLRLCICTRSPLLSRPQHSRKPSAGTSRNVPRRASV